MNKRIMSMFKACGGRVEVDSDGNYFTYTEDFDPESFAEDIIRECASLFDKDEIELTLTERTIHNMIKEHFGI
jgi:hypothetical protein